MNMKELKRKISEYENREALLKNTEDAIKNFKTNLADARKIVTNREAEVPTKLEISFRDGSSITRHVPRDFFTFEKFAQILDEWCASEQALLNLLKSQIEGNQDEKQP